MVVRHRALGAGAADGDRPAVPGCSASILRFSSVLPLLVFLASGAPLDVEYPELQGFNFVGGCPHLAGVHGAASSASSLYTAAFIAEIVRGRHPRGVARADRGGLCARPAARAWTLRLVIIPQALRVIIPPLTNQYLNLTKNSSLAVAVGYPDLVVVFARTVLNQTGQAVEVIVITMLVYLVDQPATSLFMNWFNRRIALVER